MNVEVEYSDLEGVDGAEEILAAVTPASGSILAAYNQLGDDGVGALIAGLGDAAKLARLDLTDNEVGDRGLLAALAYAAGHSALRHLSLAFNAIHLDEATTAPALAALNASHLESLTLFSNHLEPAAVNDLFDGLAAPRLATLALSRCNVGDSAAGSIAEFLASPRSAALSSLDLSNNWLSALAVKDIVDAVEAHHYGVVHLALASHGLRGARGCILFKPDFDPKADVAGVGVHIEMGHQLHERLPAVLARNRELRRRVMAAAARAVAPARILLHAEAGDEASKAGAFPLTRLPPELQLVIARHASGDAGALSEAQWARVVRYAGDRRTLGAMPACPATGGGADADARIGLALGGWCDALGVARWEGELRPS
ncbi:hypothetical protein Q8F55_005797 [Vanrija albida]|uniref:F-box domain-containing protein n=1 Tax=Vanrija albida TaxID=181172 RepID=A0ABR3Q2W0_9TREE